MFEACEVMQQADKRKGVLGENGVVTILPDSHVTPSRRRSSELKKTLISALMLEITAPRD
jgi:hypothetical protein